MKKPLVIANWKGYIQSPTEAKNVARALRRKARAFVGVDVMLAPAFPHLPAVGEALNGSGIKLAAQHLSGFEGPQHTGEVSAAMLKEAGVSAVIIGHSERRAMGEDNAQIAAQMARARGAGLTVILCVGERERDPGGGHFSFVETQLISALSAASQLPKLKLIVAYEPVWAIGKSAVEAMKGPELREMAIFIKKTLADALPREAALRVPILYGGSVEGENANVLIVEGGVSGFLVGHASAALDSFMEILIACRK